MFNGTEIQNAVKEDGGCSKLIAMYTFNKTPNACKYEILFTENAVTLGTINATANVSDDDIIAAKPTGFLFLDENADDENLITSKWLETDYCIRWNYTRITTYFCKRQVVQLLY